MSINKRKIIIRRSFFFFLGILLFSPLLTANAEQIGFWTASNEISEIPMIGCAWEKLEAAAIQADPNLATVSNQVKRKKKRPLIYLKVFKSEKG